MENRENAIAVIAERLYDYFSNSANAEFVYSGFELQHFELTPVEPIDESRMPAILLLEGQDKITNRTRRDFLGYPLTRSFEVHVELWVPHSDGNMRSQVQSFYRLARQCLFKNGGRISDSASFREQEVMGPYSEPRIGSLGMRILIDVIYKDNNL
jgi:hypothetical protein